MIKRLSLTQRLSAVFALLLLACCGASAWLQMAANARYEQEVVQRLSGGLAGHIAGANELMDAQGWKPEAVRAFDKLMAVNPAVEVTCWTWTAALSAMPRRRASLLDRVDLARCGARWPAACCPSWATIRATPARARFSVAPARAGGKDIGYAYVVLQGQAHDELAMAVSRSTVLRTTLWSIALVALLGLVAGLAAFAPDHAAAARLTRAVRAFDGGDSGALAALEDGGRDSDKDGGKDGAPDAARGGDEIALRRSFAQMGRRISEQWRELTRQDQQRRDMVANISHDLRTPLTSLHGYLETLRLKDATLEADERRRYLDIALAQSRKVGRLAQELFELARLESGLVRLEPEVFSLPELMHDVAQSSSWPPRRGGSGCIWKSHRTCRRCGPTWA